MFPCEESVASTNVYEQSSFLFRKDDNEVTPDMKAWAPILCVPTVPWSATSRSH